MPGTIQIDGTV